MPISEKKNSLKPTTLASTLRKQRQKPKVIKKKNRGKYLKNRVAAYKVENRNNEESQFEK